MMDLQVQALCCNVIGKIDKMVQLIPIRAEKTTRFGSCLKRAGLWVLTQIALLLMVAILGYYSARGASEQQIVTDTATPTLTLSPTTTLGSSVTGTITLTPDTTTSATPSATVTSSTSLPSPTLTPTFGLALTITPTYTMPASISASPTMILDTNTPTPTFLPLPAVTMIYPKVTVTPQLMSAYRSANHVQKQRLPWIILALVRFWPLALMFLVWGLLGIWFILIQHKLN
jgi:hypothetical protein